MLPTRHEFLATNCHEPALSTFHRCQDEALAGVVSRFDFVSGDPTNEPDKLGLRTVQHLSSRRSAMTVKKLVSLVQSNVNVAQKQDERFELNIGAGLAVGLLGRLNPNHRYPTPNPRMRGKASGSFERLAEAERSGAGRLSRSGDARDSWSCHDPIVAPNDGRQPITRQQSQATTRQTQRGLATWAMTQRTSRTGHRRTGNLSVSG